jgi:hypothetical protein
MHEFPPAAAVCLPPRRQNSSASLVRSHTVKGSGLERTAHQCNPGYRLRHLHMGITSGPVPVAGLAALTLHCTALEKLRCYCDGNEAEGDKIQQRVTAKRGLRSLSCAGEVISDAFLAAVAELCPQLQEIHLNKTSGYSATGLTSLVYSCKNLSRVHVSNDHKVLTVEVMRLWQQENKHVTIGPTAEGQ